MGGPARPPIPPRPPWRGVMGRVLAAVVTAGLVLAAGCCQWTRWRVRRRLRWPRSRGTCPGPGTCRSSSSASQVTQNHAEATLKLAAQVKAGQRPAPDLVWPENATDQDPFQTPAIYAEIASAVNAIGKPVLVGEVSNDPRRNVGQLWLPGRGPTTFLRQAPAGAVRRVHPVPRLHLQLQRPARPPADRLHPRPPGRRIRCRPDQAGRRDLLRGGLR